MKKSCFYLMCLLIVLASNISMAANRAVEISIGGIGPPVDGVALQTIRQVIGFGVGQGVINKFIVNDFVRPIEGGFTGCVQASLYTDQFGAFVKQLKSIKPNPLTTAYRVRWVASCKDYQPDLILCTQEVKQCLNGTYVGRTGSNCAFAPCPK